MPPSPARATPTPIAVSCWPTIADDEADDPGEDRQLGQRGTLPQGAGGRSSGALDPMLRRWTAAFLLLLRSTAASRPANGHPEETLTRHQPISIPSGPRRGARVPAAAARLAEVGAADPHPLVIRRRGEHRRSSSRLAVSSTRPRSAQRPARLGDPVGERVADLLQLAEVEHPRRRRASAATRCVDLDAAEEPRRRAGRARARARPIWRAQLGAREALVDLDVKCDPSRLLRAAPAWPAPSLDHGARLARRMRLSAATRLRPPRRRSRAPRRPRSAARP